MIGTALVIVGLMLIVRLGAPSDLWDQTQPRTIAYTTYLLAADAPTDGSWALPIDAGGVLATKPPLYNWIAAPFVAVFGTTSELAHRAPSLLAFAGLVIAMIRAGTLFGGRAIGALAVTLLVASYTIFKLSVLARPDMLLTLALTVGWIAGTALLQLDDGDRRAMRRCALVFWLACAAALLTKGPPALLLPLYALLAPRVALGSWRATRRFGWSWGVPLALAPFGGWLIAALITNAEHVRDVMVGAEIVGRVTGRGPEGGGEGWRGILLGLTDMPGYFVVRFAPWSLASLAGAIVVLRRQVGGADALAARAALLFVAIVVVLFSLSSGKRADYIASAYPAAALLGAWWMTWAIAPAWRRPVAMAVAAISLGVVAVIGTWEARIAPRPAPRFGDEIVAFARAAKAAVDADPAPVHFCWTDVSPVKPLMGYAARDDRDAVVAALRDGHSGWLVAGPIWADERSFAEWYGARPGAERLRLVLASADLPRASGWPGQLRLYRFGATVDRSERAISSD